MRSERDELALEHVVLIHLLTSERVFEQGCGEDADARERIPSRFRRMRRWFRESRGERRDIGPR